MQERHLLAFIGYFKKQNELQFLAISVFEKKGFVSFAGPHSTSWTLTSRTFADKGSSWGTCSLNKWNLLVCYIAQFLPSTFLKSITILIVWTHHFFVVICIFFWQYVILVLAENPYQGAVSVLTVLFALGIRYTDLEQVGVTVGTVCNYIMIPVRALQSFNCSRVCNDKKETFWWLFWRKIWGFLIKAY